MMNKKNSFKKRSPSGFSFFVIKNKVYNVCMDNMTLKEMEKLHGRKKKPIGNISLKYKMAFVTALVALIPMITLAFLMIFFYSRATLERGNRQIQENIRIMSDRIAAVIDNGTVCSNNFTITTSNFYNDRTMKQVTRESRLLSEMTQDLLIYRGIDSIVYLNGDGLYITTDPALADMELEIRQSEYINTLINTNGATILMNAENNPMSREGREVVTLGKRVINTVTGEGLGFVLINLDRENLVKSAKSEISSYFLYDKSGYCISDANYEGILQSEELFDRLYAGENGTFIFEGKNAILEFGQKEINNESDWAKLFGFSDNSAILQYDGSSYLIARDDVTTYHWTLIGITNLNKFNVTGEELRFIMMITIGIAAVLLLISVLISVTLITRPLTVLHDGAEQIAEGDMTVRFHFKTRDEIGQLGRIFNYMTERNRELIEKVDEEAKKKREYELALIQEQVKPHFLYNTLDIIIMLIEMSRSKEAARVTQKLANYYKNSLSGSEEIVTVEREIQITRDYLDLQVMRYGDKFKYRFDIEDKIMGLQIPKMTLQPLVENAIYHGLKYKEEWGTITITGKLTDDGGAEVTVSDDGIGIEPERLKAMQDILARGEIPEDSERKHFGVYSVDHRMRLYYGDEYGIKVESVSGEGCTIKLKLRRPE